MRVIRRMSDVKISDRFTCHELRERLERDDITAMVKPNRLRWYGHVLRNDENDWGKTNRL